MKPLRGANRPSVGSRRLSLVFVDATMEHGMNQQQDGDGIVVVGAGPAGMAVAGQFSKSGHRVIILNRDCKVGGLAEYGIFPSKHRLRTGLQKTYREVLSRPNVFYFGNVSVGRNRELTVEELRGLGADAIVFATGAQGKEIIAVVRRGPAERKYNPKETHAVCSNVDKDALVREFARIRERLEAVGQNPDVVHADMVGEFKKCDPAISGTMMRFRFLSSPRRMLVDAQNRVRALEVENTRLERKGDDTAAKGMGAVDEIRCDSVIFAVGDRVDDTVGLPYKNGMFITNPTPSGHEPDDAWFQVYDEASGKVVDGVFVAGWARKASEGLVGIAKRDGEWCGEVVQRYLANRAPRPARRPREGPPGSPT